MRNGGDVSPRVPIPGTAGATIYAALQRMATHCGAISINICKERVAGGGYVYTITHSEPPEVPASNRS